MDQRLSCGVRDVEIEHHRKVGNYQLVPQTPTRPILFNHHHRVKLFNDERLHDRSDIFSLQITIRSSSTKLLSGPDLSITPYSVRDQGFFNKSMTDLFERYLSLSSFLNLVSLFSTHQDFILVVESLELHRGSESAILKGLRCRAEVGVIYRKVSKGFYSQDI